MSDDAPKPAAGWYPTPDGSQRYWDGDQWLRLPEPETITTPAGATANARPAKRPKRGLIIAAVAMAAVLVIGGGSAIAWKVVNDQQVAAAEQEASEVAAEEAAAKQDAEERAAAAVAAAEKADRAARAAAVPGIEQSIWLMADGHIADRVVDGPPVLSVDCSPVNGGLTDDLTEQTTVFECFVANVDNGDGTMTGYTYNATMNWSTGRYTYGLGAA